MTDSKLLTSPSGAIKFLALRNTVKTYDGDKDVYKIRLEIDSTTPEGMEFRNAVAAVNENKIITKDVPEGYFQVNCQSLHPPKIVDGSGSVINTEDAPRFDAKTDTGTAKFLGKVDTRGKQGTLHLVGVILQELNIAEREPSEQDSGIVAQLKAAAQNSASQ